MLELGLGLECRSARGRVVLGAFAWPFLSGASAWGAEWAGFVARAGSSQFTLLALFDLATCLAMISAAVADPMADDARRRRRQRPLCAWRRVAWILNVKP